MKPEAQRIAIVEACGWNLVEGCPDLICWEQVICDEPGLKGSTLIESDPLNDLNAMHEAEKHLIATATPLQRSNWFIELQFKGNLSGIHATAAQRAEAFLRTLGKWEKE